ncbi:MAG: hypothetical protein ABGW91_12875 [Christiangramia sp.]|nr:hypothetical protein [Christiangramia flava]
MRSTAPKWNGRLYICSVKQLLPLFAILIVLRPAMPVATYFLNYEYIATELCENKDRPELKCNGQCYLMKSLAEAAEKESQDKKEQSAKKVEIPLLFLQSLPESRMTAISEELQHNFSAEDPLYTYLLTGTIFHPPCS